MVSVNYRIGAFGFLHLDDLFDGASGSGNAGLLDQIFALKWIRENIDHFGGDPHNVTIFGESAGGFAVADLMAAPAATGLFKRAIIESGGSAVHTARGATAITERALHLLDVRPGDLDYLQTLPARRLVDVVEELKGEAAAVPRDERRGGHPGAHPMRFLPVVDGVVLMNYPDIEVANGCAAGVDLMIGWCADELNIYRPTTTPEILEATYRGSVQAYISKYGGSVDDLLAVYGKINPGSSDLELVKAALADARFRIPSVQFADAQVQHHDSVWVYEFAWQTPAGDGSLGSPHTLEIPFVFDQLVAPILHGEAPPRGLAAAIHGAWVQFANTGRPDHGAMSDWPRYSPTDRRMMVLDENMPSRDVIHPDLRRTWEQFIDGDFI